MKTVTIPFDLEMAKKIQSGEVKGKIVDKIGIEYEIVKYDAKGNYPMIGVYFDKQLNTSHARSFTTQGIYDMEKESNRSLQLVLPWYLTYEEQLTIARLGCMRVWNLKQKLVDIMHDNESRKCKA